jgi:hypothetical protein
LPCNWFEIKLLLHSKGTWIRKDYAKDFLALGKKNIMNVCYSYLRNSEEKKSQSQLQSQSNSPEDVLDTSNEDLLLLLDDASDNENIDFTFSAVLEKEKDIFLSLINSTEFIKPETNKKMTTIEFWLSQVQTKNPILKNLFECALILRNIPASSAFVERFFSICGIVHRKRAGNMNDKTLVNRSFLKSNLKIFDSLI